MSPRRRQDLRTIFGTALYLIPMFVLWHRQNFPDSFGIHITAHGEAGLLESWWYSYRLLERHQVCDVILFLYMWAAPIVAALWLFRMYRKKSLDDVKSVNRDGVDRRDQPD